MASQVLNGTGNIIYTNNTGQNVRVVINYMRGRAPSVFAIIMRWGTVQFFGLAPNITSSGGVSVTGNAKAIGKNLAYYESAGGLGNNFLPATPASAYSLSFPTEIMLAPGENFVAEEIDAYNIVVIPEAG